MQNRDQKGDGLCVILAGGAGTRLRALWPGHPKSMVPIGTHPFLERQINQWRNLGVRRFILCIGYRGDQIRAYFKQGEPWGVEIAYSEEKTPLGTGGALGQTQTLVNSFPFWAMNGDTVLSDFPAADFSTFHRRQALSAPDTAATLLAVRPSEEAHGNLMADPETQALLRFDSKRFAGKQGLLLNAGVYLLEKRIFDFIPKNRPCSLEDEVFPRILKTGAKLWVYEHQGFFGDMGTPEGYQRVKDYLEAGAK